jgi:hypothetical protein
MSSWQVPICSRRFESSVQHTICLSVYGRLLAGAREVGSRAWYARVGRHMGAGCVVAGRVQRSSTMQPMPWCSWPPFWLVKTATHFQHLLRLHLPETWLSDVACAGDALVSYSSSRQYCHSVVDSVHGCKGAAGVVQLVCLVASFGASWNARNC